MLALMTRRKRYMKIRVIEPVVSKVLERASVEELAPAARADTELSAVSLDAGPASIESTYEASLAAPQVVAKIVEAEKEGVDAVISNCMDDPGVEAAREWVAIPVIGPAETSMHIAAMLGHRFSIIGVLEADERPFHDHARKAGLEDRLASVRAIDIPVLELEDRDRALSALVEQSVRAVREDGAHIIIFGCTGMAGMAQAVEEGLREQDITDVPVIDPAKLSLKVAEALADMGLSHSKRTYPTPPEKEIVGY
jgi:allantoin racemase